MSPRSTNGNEYGWLGRAGAQKKHLPALYPEGTRAVYRIQIVLQKRFEKSSARDDDPDRPAETETTACLYSISVKNPSATFRGE